MKPVKSNHAFTLIELLAVIGIIAVLMAILIPTLSKVRTRAKSTKCMSNLRQTYVAMDQYLLEHSNRFPKKRHFMFELLPYMGYTRDTPARLYACPGATSPGFDPISGNSTYGMTGYGSNPCILPPAVSRAWPVDKYVNIANIRRNTEVMLFADAGQQISGNSPCFCQWWGEYNEISHPVAARNSNGEELVSDAPGGGIGQLGWMPAGETLLHFRHGGVANAVFLDGHVESIEPGQVKKKNLHTVY